MGATRSNDGGGEKKKKSSSFVMKSPLMISTPRSIVTLPDLKAREAARRASQEERRYRRSFEKVGGRKARSYSMGDGDEKKDDYDNNLERTKFLLTSHGTFNAPPSADATDEDSVDSHDITDPFKGQSTPLPVSLLYGIINAAVILPVILSFGSIIYRDPFFRPYLPVLIKLTLISGVVHQICFSTFSSLPFAVGQVQDAGLIFLSAMAGDMANRCIERGYEDDVILATVTVGLGLFTALLGAGLMLIGKLRLAGYVKYLPTPVVGGYLAYIGFYCGQAGLAFMAGVEVTSLSQWPLLFEDGRGLLILPGLVGGLAVYGLARTLQHMMVLPGCVLGMIAVFYAGLAFTGKTVDDARAGGWLSNADEPPVW